MEQSARRERERAEHDSLTGLGNRRFLERFLSASTPGTAGTVAALMVDIDNLKTINDMYGHLAGDAAINSVARSLVESTRPQDVVVRFGGDEFVVLLPGLDEDAAMRVGERIVGEVSAQRLPDPIQGVALGVSVGVRVSPAWALDFAELDEALYSAKSAGKGRVQRLD